MAIEELRAERDMVLPELMSRMWGNGGFHVDTDSMDLANESDAHQMEWLARIVAGFVLRERAKHEATAASLEARLETVDDRVCDLILDAHWYATPEHLSSLKSRLSTVVDTFRAARETAAAPEPDTSIHLDEAALAAAAAWGTYKDTWAAVGVEPDLSEQDDFVAGYRSFTEDELVDSRPGRSDSITWSDRLNGLSHAALSAPHTQLEAAWASYARARRLHLINAQSLTYGKARNVFVAGWTAASRQPRA